MGELELIGFDLNHPWTESGPRMAAIDVSVLLDMKKIGV